MILKKTIIKIVLLVATMSVLFSACNKETDAGMELLPEKDLIHVRTVVVKDAISSFIVKEEPLALGQSSTNLLGVFNDPKFGKTSVNFAAHYRPTSYRDFGTNPVVDSVQLKLVYKQFYGDTVTAQTLKVYEIDKTINVDSVYSEAIDLTQFINPESIGSTSFIPKKQLKTNATNKADSLVNQIISIPIKKEIGERLMSIDSATVTNIDEFLKVFKGLMIQSDKVADGEGALISLLNQYTALVVYYNNDENKAKDKDDRKTLSYAYSVTKFSARVNSYQHDYSNTKFVNQINDTVQESKSIYIQPTFGLKSKITIDGLKNWKDSANIAINKAELIFTVDTTQSEIQQFLPPYQLLLTVINDEGKEYLPRDYAFSPSYYGGTFNADYTYRFNITQHLQEILDNKDVKNNGFYLATSQKTGVANRVILKGSKSNNGIKMVITYSKFAQ